MNRLYQASHEWVVVQHGEAILGISVFAQKELGDVVYVDLPEIGSEINAGDVVATVESIKAVVDVYSPVSGTVVAVNENLEDAVELVNNSPLEEGWFMRIATSQTAETLTHLMSEKDYLAGH